MSSVRPGDSERTPCFEIQGVPPGDVYIHPHLTSIQYFNLDAYTNDRKCNESFILDLQTDEGLSSS